MVGEAAAEDFAERAADEGADAETDQEDGDGQCLGDFADVEVCCCLREDCRVDGCCSADDEGDG